MSSLTPHEWIAVGVVALLVYAKFHHRGYRRRRRSGLSVTESLRGPFGTSIRIRKRF